MKKQPNISTPELLVNLLTEEIKRFDNYSNRLGMNFWVLITAFSGVIWLLLSIIKTYKLNLKSLNAILLTLVILYIIQDILQFIISIINYGQSNEFENSNFQLASMKIGDKRIMLLFRIIRALLIIFIIFHINKIFKNHLIDLLYLPYLLYLLVYIMAFAVSFFAIPLSLNMNQKNRIANWFMFFLNFCKFVGVFILVKLLITSHIDIETLKISIILFSLTVILGLMAEIIKEHSPLLNSLINLRRDIVLNKISFEDAINQTDIIFSGLSLSNILQKYVEKVIQKERRISNILNLIANKYDVAKNAAKDNKCSLCSTLIESAGRYLEEAENLMKEYITENKRFFRFHSRLLLSMSKTPTLLSEYQELTDKIHKSRNNLKKSLDKVKSEVASFKKDLNALQKPSE